MYALAMTINHHYWKHNCKCHCARQAEKEVLESHSQKQKKASISGPAMASQNKANSSPVALSTNIFSSKSSLVKFTNGRLIFSLFHFLFSFSFHFIIFLFLEHRVRIRLQDTENKVEGSRTNDIIQHGHHMLASYSTHGHLE